MESEVRNRKSNRKSTKNSTNCSTNEDEPTLSTSVIEESGNPECLQQQQQRQNERLVHEEKLSDEQPVRNGKVLIAEQEANAIKLAQTNSSNNSKRKLQNGNAQCDGKKIVEILDDNKRDRFKIVVEFDVMTMLLFIVAFGTRIYRLAEPNNIV